MEVSTEKSKVLVNSRGPVKASIVMNGELLEEVTQFKYLGATLTKDGTSSSELRIRTAMATAAMARLHPIWKSNISFRSKHRLYKSLVCSIFLYGCESWTLLAEEERRIQAFENKCLRRLLRISYKDHKTNDFVWDSVSGLAGPQEPLLSIVKRRKLKWFGHVTRHDSLCKTVMQGTVEGGRSKGRPRKNWMDNIKEWTGLDTPTLLEQTNNRHGWRTLSSSAALRSPRRQTVSRD